jgi:DNA-binding protein Fis
MDSKNSGFERVGAEANVTPAKVCEQIIEKKLEDVATVLCSARNGKSRLYDEIITMMERSLFRIALRRSNNVKSAAAAYLGINRNTFQKKLEKLGIAAQRE